MSNSTEQIQQLRSSKHLRADAAKLLHQILDQGKSARECLPIAQQPYLDKDKAWLQEMVYGVLRQLPTLQYWLRKLLDKPLKNKYKVVEHLIMLGLYQIAFSRVSTHAAVSETVEATRVLKAEPLKGLVNAILRNFIRQKLNETPIGDEQIESGLPKWLYKQIQQAYPLQLAELSQAMHSRPPIWLRVNQQKMSVGQFSEFLTAQNQEFTLSEEHPDAIILAKSQDITQLPGFDQGWFAVQDGAAQLAARYLQAEKNERILDCCAAPGGKTCHILELQPNLKECIALDVDPLRLIRVQENLDRLELSAKLVSANATDIASWWDGQQFDRILLDAPCSATGVIRRHPDIKWLRKSTDIDTLVALQQTILQAMWSVLKPGGTLLYATCSILPDENRNQISRFLAQQTDASLLPIIEGETISQPGRQILPGETQMDGFYYARLLKS
ncbi:16S rRNA (cytosine(967)-C(5))-methyltransferase RsmB [Aliiglaciecola sp. LCG003]|uniref:16S rRNA (cytosine(967)-C(5))-methyltransferase RsmB n=1 Tax=Aliiglaciecola sp. LCG003 TaxID=3053655 RepID=UPI002573B0C2|nr:16S rRNA (cytosine(967)-C(5))-methyltransferase RsmB [Aliiglaciecola sp. LCG003]WJG09474.1 16S rRNA (cytosine(967)-C(5))-methyltransferase RsmB [Aliiglaciecola sp. LCG003]